MIDLIPSRCYDFAVQRESLLSQHLRYILVGAYFALSLGFHSASAVDFQAQRANLPDPVKFINKFDVVMNAVRSVLKDDMDFKIEVEDRQSGRIVTRPYEFITGSLTSSEVDKVAIKKDTITGSWLKARYSVESILEIVSPTETLVTVRTKIEALNRNVDGTESWIPLDSLGIYERRILGKISMKLLGSELPPQENKGFWSKKPQPVDPRQPRFPTAP
jgi:hypothetical protein